MAYGLRAKNTDGKELAARVDEGLELVGPTGAGRRFPNQLSDGEQQLARVLVLQPRVLLIDEPLSNLDAKLRIHRRTEIRRIKKHLGVTCLYVIHDQGETIRLFFDLATAAALP